MTCIRANIISFFLSRKKVALLRFYIFVLRNKNNHFHSSDIEETAKKLDVSHKTIYRYLRELEQLNVCVRYSYKYWRFKKNESWCPKYGSSYRKFIKVDIYDKNFSFNITNDYYLLRILSSISKSRFLCKQTKNGSLRAFSEHIQSGVSSGKHYPVSSSFVIKQTDLDVSERTINRHTRIAEQRGLIHIKKYKRTVFKGKYSDCLEFIEQNDLQNEFIIVQDHKKVKDGLIEWENDRDISCRVIRYEPLCIRNISEYPTILFKRSDSGAFSEPKIDKILPLDIYNNNISIQEYSSTNTISKKNITTGVKDTE